MLPWWQNFQITTVATATATRMAKKQQDNIYSIVFDFSWDDCNTQEKLETMVKNLCKLLGGKQGENGE